MLPKPGVTELMCMAVADDRLTPEEITFRMWRELPRPRIPLVWAYNHILDTLAGQRRMSLEMSTAVIDLTVLHTPKGDSFYDNRIARR